MADVKIKDGDEKFTWTGEIVKSEPQKDRDGREYTRVTSAFMSAGKIDKQDDWTDEAELQDALDEFVVHLQKQTNSQESGLSYRHQRMVTSDQASVVEAFLMRKGDIWNGLSFDRPTGLISFRMYDDTMRKEIASGKLRGLSVEGFAKRIAEPLPKEAA